MDPRALLFLIGLLSPFSFLSQMEPFICDLKILLRREEGLFIEQGVGLCQNKVLSGAVCRPGVNRNFPFLEDAKVFLTSQEIPHQDLNLNSLKLHKQKRAGSPPPMALHSPERGGGSHALEQPFSCPLLRGQEGGPPTPPIEASTHLCFLGVDVPP